MRLQFERFTILCRDIQASLTFYRDVPGLLMVEEKTLKGAAAGTLLRLPACRMQIALLAAAADAPVIVGVFWISETPMEPLHPPIGQPAQSAGLENGACRQRAATHRPMGAAGLTITRVPQLRPEHH